MEENEKKITEEKLEVKEKTSAPEEVKDPRLVEPEPGEEVKDHYVFPWKSFLIVFGIIITLIIVCVIVILCNGGFYQW